MWLISHALVNNRNGGGYYQTVINSDRDNAIEWRIKFADTRLKAGVLLAPRGAAFVVV